MNFRGIVGLAVLGAAFAAGAFEVQNVTARQRWPWNSLIDVDFEIVQASAGDKFSVGITATCDGDTRTIVGKTYRSDIICAAGQNRLVWDVAADAPGLKTTDLRISVTATSFAANAAAYCVIDLSAGPEAATYPVRYTLESPEHVRGGSNEVCQLTEMWLKRVSAGQYIFHATDSSHAGWYNVKITKDFYCGLFECTQQQWYQVMGTWPSRFTNEVCRASRPVESVTHAQIFGQKQWPMVKTVTDDSFVGRMRARTGLSAFNLPTEGQWEYAARAGRSTSTPGQDTGVYARYSSNSGTVGDYSCDVSSGTAYVGSYETNAWGFYDCLGNVGEWTQDAYEEDLKTLYADEIEQTGFVTDPVGPMSSTAADPSHITRGGSWENTSGGGASFYVRTRAYTVSSANSNQKGRLGARFIVPCE